MQITKAKKKSIEVTCPSWPRGHMPALTPIDILDTDNTTGYDTCKYTWILFKNKYNNGLCNELDAVSPQGRRRAQHDGWSILQVGDQRRASCNQTERNTE